MFNFFLSKYTDRILLCAIEEIETGECVTFSIDQLLSILINAHKLDEIGKERSLVFDITSSGAKKTINLNQIIVGFKLADIGDVDPLTNKLVKPKN